MIWHAQDEAIGHMKHIKGTDVKNNFNSAQVASNLKKTIFILSMEPDTCLSI